MKRVFGFVRSRPGRAALVAGMVGALIAGLAAPGFACDAVVQAKVDCSTGSQVITWTITSDRTDLEMDISYATAQIGLAPDATFYPTTGFSSVVPAGGSTTATTVVPGDVTGRLDLTLFVQWPAILATQSPKTDGLPLVLNSCSATTTTPSTTTASSTTTTYPATTTSTYPTTSTTTCSWCTTTTYSSTPTSTCWCGATTTTTYPTTTTTYPTTTTTYPTTTTTYPTTTTTVYSKPPVCHHVVAQSGNGRAVVRWAAPGGGSTRVTHYVVTPYLGSSAQRSHVVKAGTTSDVVSGLVNGKTYRFRVTAKTAHGAGPPSGATNAVTIGVPTAPTGVTATSRAGRIVVRWKAPTAVNGARVVAYVVTPYHGGKALASRVLSPHVTLAKIGGLTAGRTYTFRVAALNHRGLGPKSSASNAAPAIAAHNFALVHALLSWFA